MDVDERIERRRRPARGDGLVAHWPSLDPTVHLDEPVDRGPAVERTLDALDPVFVGDVPGDAYVYGPSGSGKSAVVTAVMHHLHTTLSGPRDAIGTTTRAAADQTPTFAYVDARHASTPFALYRAVLAAVTESAVPERGVSTAAIRDRLRDALADHGGVVAVDHVGEPETPTVAELREHFAPLEEALAWVAVGRRSPGEVEGAPSATVRVRRYQEPVLTEILTERGARGLHGGLDTTHARRLAAWANGDAHDALAALYAAVVTADEAGREILRDEDVTAGLRAVPRDGVPLGRVLSLTENRKRTLDRVLADDLCGRPLEDVAAAAADGSDLSEATVTRFLYELAEVGILTRVRPADGTGGSYVETRFSDRVYRALRERKDGTA